MMPSERWKRIDDLIDACLYAVGWGAIVLISAAVLWTVAR